MLKNREYRNGLKNKQQKLCKPEKIFGKDIIKQKE